MTKLLLHTRPPPLQLMTRFFSNLMAKGRGTFTPKVNEKLSKSFELLFPDNTIEPLIQKEPLNTIISSHISTHPTNSTGNYVQPGRSYKEELYASRRFDINPSQNPNYAFRKLQTFLHDEKIPAKIKEKKHFIRPGLVKHAVIYAGRRKKFNEMVKDTIKKIVKLNESQK